MMCKACLGFYAKTSFYNHRRLCAHKPMLNALTEESDAVISGRTPAYLLGISDRNTCSEFQEQICSKFQNDEVGELCKSNKLIQYIGNTWWQKHRRKPGKKTEVRKSVMRDMRRLALLFHRLGARPTNKPITLYQMFNRANFNKLEETIEDITPNDNVADALDSS